MEIKKRVPHNKKTVEQKASEFEQWKEAVDVLAQINRICRYDVKITYLYKDKTHTFHRKTGRPNNQYNELTKFLGYKENAMSIVKVEIIHDQQAVHSRTLARSEIDYTQDTVSQYVLYKGVKYGCGSNV